LLPSHLQTTNQPPTTNHPAAAAGIIYVSDSELGWEPITKSWLARRTDSAQVEEAGGRGGLIAPFSTPLHDADATRQCS